MRVALIAILLTCCAAPAAAQPATSKHPVARRHLQRALKLFDAKDYARAIEEFRAALKLDPQPRILYALGQAERLSGDCAAAIKSYEGFLKMAPSARQAEAARQNIARCEAELKAKEAPPEPTPPPLQPLQPVAPAPARTPEPAPAPRPWYFDWLGDTLGISGVVVLGVGAAVWANGRGSAQDARSAQSYDGFAAAAPSAELKQQLGVALMATGAALIGGGVVRFLLRRPPERLSVAAAAGPGSGSVVLMGRF
jgi:tetratricopeptide (TPR) repeat protein